MMKVSEFGLRTIILSYYTSNSITFVISIELNCKKTSIIVRPTQYEKLIKLYDGDTAIVVIYFVIRVVGVITPTSTGLAQLLQPK